MDYKTLQEAVKNGYSTYQISKLTGKSPTNVRYWLKKYNLVTAKTHNRIATVIDGKIQPKTYKCKECGEKDIEKMMKNGNSGYCKNLCKSCHNKNTIERGRDNKKKAVEYKGSKCIKCNYDSCVDALEFHHRDPNQKDADFKKIRWWGWNRIAEELDKCDLLCCRCHREVHAELNKKKLGR